MGKIQRSTKVKVSHEVPLQLLGESKQFNDYDYCLPHLLDQYEDYKNYFYQAKKEGRYIIMDNSLHELGEAYDTSRLLYWISELEPDEFIVPDVWENGAYSVRNARAWANIEMPDNTTKVAVVQGKSYSDFVNGYQSYKWFGYQKIAFSYGASWFQEAFQHPNPYVAKMMGRLKTITNLYKGGLITDTDRVHLLGCNLPQAFFYYKDFPFIESIDTSNPVIHGLKRMRYSEGGLLHKDKEKIDENFTQNITPKQKENVLHNVNMFRKINQL
jgi:hypothetical protein